VSTDLDAGPGLPDAVGVVHDRRRQPQHALLDAVEDGEIELRLSWRYGDQEIVCGLLAVASSRERLDYQ
jgi:hypothetical protein